MNKKKILTIALALVLVVAMTVAGTLAVLKETAPAELQNTFVAAGGGKIIPTPLADNFKLQEHAYTWDADTAAYTQGALQASGVAYDGAAPGMDIPKDPMVSVNVVKGASAYIFVKIVDTASLIDWEIDDSNWVAVSGYDGVYVYKNIVAGTSDSTTEADFELYQVNVLKDKHVSVQDTTFPAAVDGTVDLGAITITAYACQAQGFDDAAAAWADCFA